MDDKVSRSITVHKTVPRLFCWGSGAFGQHGHIIDENIGAFDGFLKNPSVDVLLVSCGACYSFVLKGDGTVFGWGNNQYGQIGCGHQRQCLTPTRSLIEDAVQISAGDRHTLFLQRGGSVYGCGCNFYAQLSVDKLDELQRQDKLVPILLPLTEKVKQVACGQYHSLLLYNNGDVAAVGRNVYGQLGVPMPEGVKTDVLEIPATIEFAFSSTVASISAGQNHSLAVDDTGCGYVWGYSRACGSRTAHVIKPKVVVFPTEEETGSGKVASSTQLIAKACGGTSHSLFVTSDGRRLFALGCNLDGQCGLGQSINFSASPVSVDLSWAAGSSIVDVDCAENYSCAVTASGEVWVWGRNSGVLPGVSATLEADAPRVFTPRRVPIPYVVMSVACGNWHMAATVNYREPLDVTHLPDGQSRIKRAAHLQEIITTEIQVASQEPGAWVDIVSSREEKQIPSLSGISGFPSGITVARLATSPSDPLAVEDLDNAKEEGGITKTTTPETPPPPQRSPHRSPTVTSPALRRVKSLNRVPANGMGSGGSSDGGGAGRQHMRLRRMQPSSVQLDSEVVHVYRLNPASVRFGTTTYQVQTTNGPPQLDQRSTWLGNNHLLRSHHQQLADIPTTVAASSKPPLPVGATSSRGPISGSMKLGVPLEVADPIQQQQQHRRRQRPASASGGGGALDLPAKAEAVPSVRQNLAYSRRMSSSGRMVESGNGGESAI